MTKSRAPWCDLIGDKPIERWFRQDDPSLGEDAQNAAFAEQFKRMCRLKEHYGIEGMTGWRPWYELAVAIVAEQNPAVTIIDPLPGRKLSGAAKLQLKEHVEFAREELVSKGKKPTWKAIHNELGASRYKSMSADTLKARFKEACDYAENRTGFPPK